MPVPKFISKNVVIRIHDDQLREYDGEPGLDEGKLDSALAMPQQTWGGEFLHPTLFDQAAAYLYHIAKGHAFIDGNKRTALAVTILFLRKNGYRLTMPKDEAYDLTLRVADDKDHQVTKEEISRLLKENSTYVEYGSQVLDAPPSLES